MTNIVCETNAVNDDFSLVFFFKENEFFTNQSLKLEFAHDKRKMISATKSDEIDWKEGKNLCEKVTVKTQKHKKSGQVRKIKKSTPQPSFFHCFKERTGD